MLAALLGLFLLTTGRPQSALYWDTNGTTSGAGSANGTWSTGGGAANNRWNSLSGGGSGGTIGKWSSGSDAVFSAGTDDTGSYTVTLAANQNVSSINVQEGNPTFNSNAINFNDGSPDFTVATGSVATVNSDITGTNGINKLGAGTLVFGTNDKAYSGTTTVGAGTLELAFNQSFSVLDLAGGTLKLSSTSTTITTLNVTSNSTIDFGGASAALNLTNLTVSAGVTLNIINWVNAADFFVAQNWTGASFDTTASNPMNQVVFNSPTFTGDNTKWQSYDKQITPVPEPSVYGAALIGLGGALVAWRRRVRR